MMRKEKMVPDGRSSTGFTLIEMLIALALMSILLGAVYSVFFMSHKALDGSDESLLKLRESRMVLDMMAREAEAVLFSADNRNSIFSIEDRDIYGKHASRFTLTSFSPLTPGLSAITYYVEENNGTRTLYKKLHSAFNPEKDIKGVELMEGIDSFLVEAGDSSKWLKTWDGAEVNKLPAEIRLTITFMIKDRPVTIYETVRPALGKQI